MDSLNEVILGLRIGPEQTHGWQAHVESRLDRKELQGVVRFGSADYSREELVAELTSAFCCASVKLDNSLIDNSAAYLKGWLRALKDDPKMIVVASARAQKAADYIRGVTQESGE